jgi:hypothetical protein
VLISGNDFYASPRIDQNKKRMAWIEWGHPNMAWDKSELWVGYFSESGLVNYLLNWILEHAAFSWKTCYK